MKNLNVLFIWENDLLDEFSNDIYAKIVDS